MHLLTRRRWLASVAAAAGAAWPGAGRAVPSAPPHRLAASWEAAPGYRVGVLQAEGAQLVVRAALEVPTRAHGVWPEPGERVLAVARRPGDWLVRLSAADGRALAWAWTEPARALNGHVIASRDGRRLYTTETDLETAGGLIGVRDAASLEKLDEWPTHGMDPHELLLDEVDGTLLVANGGIPTLPETGRLKVQLHRMDASLVRLDAASGELRGQWRLADPRLSLRHMAWGPRQPGGPSAARVLGIALQAEHEDAQARAAAPLLARFDGRHLTLHDAGQALAGYGGDIAFAGGCFAVSCPRAQGVGLWSGEGRWLRLLPLAEACALTTDSAGQRLWAGGQRQAMHWPPPAGDMPRFQAGRLDNHWQLL